MDKNVINLKLLLLCFFWCVLTIYFSYSKYASNNIFSKQQKFKVEISKLKDRPRSYSNQKKTSTEPYGKQWMNEKEKKYKKDRERIQEICKKYNITSRKKIDKGFLLVDRNHKMAFCWHAKVGSSTLNTHLKHLIPTKIQEKLIKQSGMTPYEIDQPLSKKFRNYYIISENDVLGGSRGKIPPYLINNFIISNNILTASFVRHPFERLVSAYNDKFGGNDIKITWTNVYQEWFKNEKSFSRFVNLVLYEYRRSCYPDKTQALRLRTNWFNDTCEDKINKHWRPFGFQCSYCDVSYDLIGRLETWNDDINYIIRKRGLEQVLPLQNANSSHRHASRHNTKEMTKEYFNTLSQKQKEDLYHMFRLDFEMFNYDPNIYS